MKRSPVVVFLMLFACAALFAQTTVQSQTSSSTAAEAAAQASKPGASTGASAAKQTTSQTSATAAGKSVNAAAAGDTEASGAAATTLPAGTVIPARLTKTLDSKKAKEGDQVVAKTTSNVKAAGDVVIPKGSKLLGRVTRADARASGESQSALGIAFERAILKDGREMPLHVVIQAVAAAETATAASLNDDAWISSGTSAGASGGGSAGGGLLGGAGATAGAVTGAATNTVGNTVSTAAQTGAGVAGGVAGSAGQAGATAGLTSNTSGVIGLQGLTLETQASNSTSGSVIASEGKSVRLESGTRLMLRAGAQ
jgi:hypothetical protein